MKREAGNNKVVREFSNNSEKTLEAILGEILEEMINSELYVS